MNSGVTAIAAGGFAYSCAIVDVAAQCWGRNSSGQLGNDSEVQSSVVVSVQGLDDGVTAIAAGGIADSTSPFGHSCAIHYDFIKCWGANTHGQLGEKSEIDSDVPVQVQNLSPVIPPPSQLRADIITTESIAISWTAPIPAENILITGYTVSWGVDLADQNTLKTASVSTPMTSYVITDLNPGTPYQIVVAAMIRGGTGPRSTILMRRTRVGPPTAPRELNLGIVRDNSIAISWVAPVDTGGMDITIMEYIVYWRELVDGANDFETLRVSAPTTGHVVDDLNAATSYQIAVAAVNSEGLTGPRSNNVFSVTLLPPPSDLTLAGVTTDSIAVSWQPPSPAANITAYIIYWNVVGQGVSRSSTVPITQTNYAITEYVITELEEQTKYQIKVAAVSGDGLVGARTEPLVVPTLGPIAQIATMVGQTISAGFEHSCAVYNGSAWCWGTGRFGRLGDGSNGTTYRSRPVGVEGLNDGVTAIAAGGTHSCAIQNGAAKCWGAHHNGRLGRGPVTPANAPIPAAVSGLDGGVTAIAAGRFSSCAIQDGIAKCWGSQSSYGILGDGSGSSESLTPVKVSGLDGGVTAITIGIQHACAIQRGSAWCWGRNSSGQLGNDSQVQSPVAVRVEGLEGRDVTAIAVGFAHSCAVVNATARCWGLDSNGQLGDSGANTNSRLSVLVQGLDGRVTAIAAGGYHNCAIVDAAARCWGLNDREQLGNDSQAQSSVAVRVEGLEDGVTAIAAGDKHSCAVHYGFIKCWGQNAGGQLGNNSRGESDVPVEVHNLNPLMPPLQLRADVITTNSIAISWIAPISVENVPITAYTISWISPGGVAFADQSTHRTMSVPALMKSYVITDLSAGTLYNITITSVNRGGTSSRSDIFTRRTQLTLPTAPVELNLDRDRVTTNSIVVNWQPPASTGGENIAITGYIVYWRELVDGANDFETIRVSAPMTSYMIGGLNVATDYQIAVAAVTLFDIGQRSEILQGSTLDNPPPPPPPSSSPTLSVLVVEDVRSSSITINWEPPTQPVATIERYTIYWSVVGRSASEFSISVNDSQRSYIIEELEPLVKYRITVIAEGAGGREEELGRSVLEVRTLRLAEQTQTIAAGVSHSCAIYNNTAWCWGKNETGQLGDGSQTPSSTPVRVGVGVEGFDDDGVAVIAVSRQQSVSCAVVNGAARCWGEGRYGQLGNDGRQDSFMPAEVLGGLQSGVSMITVGEFHTCAIVNAAARCWGYNFRGQSGAADIVSINFRPVHVQNLDNSSVTAITAGAGHTCAIVDAEAQCWGTGITGQLGVNLPSPFRRTEPGLVPGLEDGVTAIAAGNFHTCAIRNDGVRCWGSNGHGQLGKHRRLTSSADPVEVDDLQSGVSMITAGANHTCAIVNAAARCWGLNDRGQLGVNSPSRSSTPRLVLGLEDGVTAIAAGDKHTCAIHYGFIKCWGNNDDNQLGVDGIVEFSRPVTVRGFIADLLPLTVDQVTPETITISWDAPTLTEDVPITTYTVTWGVDLTDRNNPSTVASVLAPMTSYVITGLNAGTLYQIEVIEGNPGGILRSEMLEQDTAGPVPHAPVNINLGAVTFNSLTVSWEPPTERTAIIRAYVVYWREADSNSFSTIRVLASERSYAIKNLSLATRYEIAVAAENSGGRGPLVRTEIVLAQLLLPPRVLTLESVTTDSIAVSWRPPINGNGVEGDVARYIVYWNPVGRMGTQADVSTTNYVITGLDVGARYQIAVTAIDLDIAGSETDRSAVIEVQTLGLATMAAQTITVGVDHSCAAYNEAAWCWGDDQFNRLGNGSFQSHSRIPEQVSGLAYGVTAVAAGNFHTCAIQHGVAKCWGRNDRGQLGSGSVSAGTVGEAVAISVDNLNGGVTAIAAGNSHTCAIQDSAAWCWGVGDEGRLSNSDMSDSSIPVAVQGLDGGVTAIAAGFAHTCAIQRGSAKCWGQNDDGQLGVNSPSRSSEPRSVEGLADDDVTAIAAGGFHTCVIQNSAAQCWGRGDAGQLGYGVRASTFTPVPVFGLQSGVTMIAAGAVHSCAIQYGAVKCWGDNSDNSNNIDGRLGDDGNRTQSLIPTAVQGLDDGVTAIAAGGLQNNLVNYGHSCAIHYGAVRCWGRGSMGQLGNNSNMNVFTPVSAQGLNPFPLVAAPSRPIKGAVTAESIAVSWTAPVRAEASLITTYIVFWGTDLDDANSLNMASVPFPMTSYLIDGLNPGTVYQIAVVAMNPSGVSPYSAVLVSGTVARFPTAPTQLDLAAITTNSITVRWKVPTDTGGTNIVQYNVSWGVNINNSSQSRSVPGSVMSYTIDDLVEETAYQIVVTAENLFGPGLSSEILERVTLGMPPGPPTNLQSRAVTANSITVNWSPPASNDNELMTYTVSWGTNINNSSQSVSISASTMSYTIKGLNAETAYQIVVTAVNRNGRSPRSNVLTQVTSFVLPEAPTSFDLGAVTANSIEVSWQGPSNKIGVGIVITGYIVYWHILSQNQVLESSRTVDSAQANYVITGLEAGTRYQITVAAATNYQRCRCNAFSAT